MLISPRSGNFSKFSNFSKFCAEGAENLGDISYCDLNKYTPLECFYTVNHVCQSIRNSQLNAATRDTAMTHLSKHFGDLEKSLSQTFLAAGRRPEKMRIFRISKM